MNVPVIAKRRIRATNDFVLKELKEDEQYAPPVSKKKPKDLCLPKIDDVKITTNLLFKSSQRLSQSKDKKVIDFRTQKQTLELKNIYRSETNRIKSLKLKKAKGVWTPVKVTDKHQKLYIPIIPLEKSGLLNENQMNELMYKQKHYDSKRHAGVSSSLSDYYKPCSVILKQLGEEEMNFYLKKESNFLDSTTVSKILFSPSNTSSPNILSSDSNNFKGVHPILDNTKDNGNIYPNEKSKEGLSRTNGSVIDLNSTYEVTVSTVTPLQIVAKRLKCGDIPSKGNHEDLNGNNEIIDSSVSLNILDTTYDVNQEQTKAPKSMLKSSSKTSNSNRRVTFNDTSIIIIDDSEQSYASPTPTHFSDGRSGNWKSSFNIKGTIGGTPMPKKENSIQKKESFLRKRKLPPNFDKIHKKLFDGMIDIQEYTERKLQRSNLLLSGHKPNTNVRKLSGKYINSVTAALKKDDKAKSKTPRRIIQQSEKLNVKEMNKNSISRKEEVLSVVNKVRQTSSKREIAKVEIKGIRSNRRFQLLMNMRQNQKNK
ncbi:hypothetical protein FQA39_LY03384 [Lamprigera yunnana]|nr:hypothetical protein FQA39_LY03384 [Lamprigera yunnana]